MYAAPVPAFSFREMRKIESTKTTALCHDQAYGLIQTCSLSSWMDDARNGYCCCSAMPLLRGCYVTKVKFRLSNPTESWYIRCVITLHKDFLHLLELGHMMLENDLHFFRN
ncbi:hypothetical protein Sp245p_21570 (plasmid) [Azospirillum baldaniorum]|uniref:Uncharacterized protein n=1 Tax=Azospirillum baldaniorum TaxID=1064539 RepID=A0A9P1NPE6_9PROT|nr:hypothetical protein Sp245p_21570 [Azospirillum baldaniorum]CCD00885.1 protein of unknown function [Azospirillum baldaniorum]